MWAYKMFFPLEIPCDLLWAKFGGWSWYCGTTSVRFVGLDKRVRRATKVGIGNKTSVLRLIILTISSWFTITSYYGYWWNGLEPTLHSTKSIWWYRLICSPCSTRQCSMQIPQNIYLHSVFNTTSVLWHEIKLLQ